MQKFAMFLFVAIEFMMIHMFENEPFCIFVIFYLLFFTVRNHGIASDKPAHVPIAPTSSSISTSDNSLDAQT